MQGSAQNDVVPLFNYYWHGASFCLSVWVLELIMYMSCLLGRKRVSAKVEGIGRTATEGWFIISNETSHRGDVNTIS